MPSVGDTIIMDGVTYKCIAAEEVTGPTGNPIVSVTWQPQA